tara:strand:- start:28 stop:270 length:243 start_codon:yes stop_codon:yes gene_type:complete
MPDGNDIMTVEMLENAVLRLIPDALAMVERTLREQSKPSKAALDTAWRVIDMGRDQEVDGAASDDGAAEDLAAVLSLVGR